MANFRTHLGRIREQIRCLPFDGPVRELVEALRLVSEDVFGLYGEERRSFGLLWSAEPDEFAIAFENTQELRAWAGRFSEEGRDQFLSTFVGRVSDFLTFRSGHCYCDPDRPCDGMDLYVEVRSGKLIGECSSHFATCFDVRTREEVEPTDNLRPALKSDLRAHGFWPGEALSEGEQFVQEFHEVHAGRTECSFGRGRIGRTSSYELLADTAIALSPRARVLDLACADGALLDAIWKHRRDLVTIGLDLNQRELSLARGRGHDDLVWANAERIPLPDSYVDHVVCHMSFMLFERPYLVAEELFRVMKNGASAAMLSSDGSSPEGARRVFIDLVRDEGVGMPMVGTRVARSMDGLAEVFESAGFGVEQLEKVELNLDGSPQLVWRELSLMYNFAVLDDGAKSRVREEFFREFEGRREIPYRMSLILSRFRV